ncbi:hypothetical protein [Arthrobacter cheniae]|uniref:hypothetical protein n=1 Tax=Arthrobacter cheniae TaxID=1258888 RepID=UPI0011C437E6|nr:hypothetical protein [Arthrobacter cheniae]
MNKWNWILDPNRRGTNPDVHAGYMADGVLQVIADADEAWPHNDTVVNDPILSELIEMSVNARQTGVYLPAVVPTEFQVKVVPAGSFASPAEYVGTTQYGAPTDTGTTCCDRCWSRWNVSGQGVHRSEESKTLWVNAGAIIVSFSLCPECADYLDESFGPLVFGRGRVE